ncbi:hypothetical protein MMEU_4109 [Mycobacterium marinum str. Europe]|nr:hypothetical protein MMEU_4109 [Mycobacterium marinum str. Europe]
MFRSIRNTRSVIGYSSAGGPVQPANMTHLEDKFWAFKQIPVGR